MSLFFINPEIETLHDLEWLFYVKFFFEPVCPTAYSKMPTKDTSLSAVKQQVSAKPAGAVETVSVISA